ncbi:10842_t:CDS:2, partial [Racocetra persica]
ISSTLGQLTFATFSSTSTLRPPISTSLTPTSPTSVPSPISTSNPTNLSNPISSSDSNFTTPPVTVPYNTVDVPPNNGTWTICSNESTRYISYSVKVVDSIFPITPGYGKTTPGTSSPLATAPQVGIAARIRYANAQKFIPSLSCYLQFTISCDQDTGNIPVRDNDNYCLDIINPASSSQRVNVTASFTKSSVFEGGGFTSANQPGGNAESPISKANIPMSKIWVE